jgi:hypothetical protein
MKDLEIRQYFHKIRLKKHHLTQTTLVVDELGLKHGRCRADIAVINGHLDGFEIKGDNDSLLRLPEQIVNYNLVFDHATLVVGSRHIQEAKDHLPEWWGVILCEKGSRGAINFKSIRKTKFNKNVDPQSVAELLWRSEAEEILRDLNVSPKVLRQPRAILYKCLIENFDIKGIRDIVRECLKKRKNWRCPQPAFPYGDLCQPIST